jgi:hypothetical protein
VLVTIEPKDTASDRERAAWLELGELSLMKTWDNAADEVFNELLEK